MQCFTRRNRRLSTTMILGGMLLLLSLTLIGTVAAQGDVLIERRQTKRDKCQAP